jgi:hypothetical protein
MKQSIKTESEYDRVLEKIALLMNAKAGTSEANELEMLAICWQHVTPTRHCRLISPTFPFFCQHPFLPIRLFPRILMSGNANISIVTQKYNTTIIYPQLQK